MDESMKKAMKKAMEEAAERERDIWKERLESSQNCHDEERARNAKLVAALEKICDSMDADTHIPKRAIARAALEENETTK